MISIKHLLPRWIVGYSKNTPVPGEYKELYYNYKTGNLSSKNDTNELYLRIMANRLIKFGYKIQDAIKNLNIQFK